MPIYEYRCTKCGDETEVLQRVGETPKRKCTSCSGKLEKLISRTSFHLKGGGWYNEGYSSDGKKKKKPAADSAKSKPSTETPKKPAKKASAG